MIASFEEIEDYSKIGSKATSLIMMKKNGFTVPNGFVIDSDSYEEVIQQNNLQQTLLDLLKKMTLQTIPDTSKQLTDLFEKIKIDASMKQHILEKLSKEKKYAVRSSGTLEDLAEYSFAGQYQTFLNVSAEQVIEKMVNCYQSMFSETNLNYVIHHQIDASKMKMSVVVQEMVDSELSGICFTIDPITGNDKEMLIEVGKGLGENIVSGKVAPEQYYYQWIEKKSRFDSENTLLSDSFLNQIAKTFFEIQSFYGYPCDIEFAIQNKKLYILQARKITSIKYQGYQEMWSTADFKDGGVSATICYPYMWSLYEYIWEYTLRKFLLDSKILSEKELYQKKLGQMYFARPYWNMTVVKLAMSKVIGYKEREFDNEFGVKSNYEGDGQTTKVSLKSLAKIIRMAIAQKKILKERNKKADLLKADLLNRYNIYKDKYDAHLIQDIEKEWYQLTHDDYLYSESTYFWQIFINTVHQSIYKNSLLKYVTEAEYLTLLGSIDNISHLLPFYQMWKISREIRESGEKKRYWLNTEIKQIVLDIQSGKVDKSVQELIRYYGYHSDKELDVSYPCYYEDITPLITSIKEMVPLSDEYSPVEDSKRGKQAYEAIINDIAKKVKPRTLNRIKRKIQNMRKMLWWREEFRDVSTRLYYLIRIYTLKLAEKLVQDKILETKEDVWFLKVGDIWNLLDKKLNSKDIQKIIQDNKKYYYAYLNYMSDNEIGQNFVDAPNENKLDTQIKGLGANNGIVTGIARVIESFDEIERLKEGDILVTIFTDTGWTPKFAILSGIVTEYGGILCHAAIVSREYGIPAIVNCHDAMKKIKNGQKITIDGATGLVQIDE